MGLHTLSLAGIARTRAWSLIVIAAWWPLCVSAWQATAAELEPGATASTEQSELLGYSVRWLGLRCGVMTVRTTTAATENDRVQVTHLDARTRGFCERIYPVRVHIESRTGSRGHAPTTYHRVQEENGATSEEEMAIDHQNRTIVHREDGHERSFSFERSPPLDPLAYLLRLRTLLHVPGDRAVLKLVTAEGPIETTALARRSRSIRTPLGRCDALHVISGAPGGALFQRSEKIEMWIGADPAGTPCKIEFKLPVGTLVAVITDRHPMPTSS